MDVGACNYNPDATVDDGTCAYDVDCTGVCDGDAEIETFYFDIDNDGLGAGIGYELCNGLDLTGWVTNNDDTEPYCSTNNTDECGVCGGDDTTCLDDCGVPNGNNSSCLDCAGVVNGDAYYDECGICNANSDDDCEQDCAGVWGGSAEVKTYYFDGDDDGLGFGDSYELCNGLDLTGWVTNDQDTDDNCFSNFHDCALVCDGTSVIDECGECGGDNTSCADCAGVPNGDNVTDQCDTCDADSSNDCVQDCMNVWGGDAEIGTYYFDFDDDGLGFGDSYELCNGLDLIGWVTNNDDFDDNCTSNEHDCVGVCDGSSEIDECGVCDSNITNDNITCADCTGEANGPNNLDNCGTCDSNSANDCVQDCNDEWGGDAEIGTYYFDDDGDGLGYGEAISLCNSNVPPGMVSNNDDIDDNCTSNEHDCVGVCDGTSVIDECNVCGGDGIPEGECDCFGNVLDCNDECGGSGVFDECGICDDNPDNDCIQDCNDEWGGDAVVETYYFDGDGDGLGYGEAISLCNSNVPPGMVSNNDDIDDNCTSNEHDCVGVCDGTSVIDECNVCGGDGIPEGECDCFGNVLDCNDECGGSGVFDECVICDADSSNDCVQDCMNAWGGDAEIETYYFDGDGDGLGSGDPYELCNGLDLTGWASNYGDDDDNCTSNEHDCVGVCDGTSVIDECNVCGGDGIPEGECDCAGTELDCNDECDGSGVLDNCGTCDADPGNDCVQDCAGQWGGPDNVTDTGDEATIDNCGTCDNNLENNCIVVNAGEDQAVAVPHDGDPNTNTVNVSLNGCASDGPGTLTYSWTWEPGGSNPNCEINVYLTPNTYVFQLTVSNDYPSSYTDEVIITVLEEPNEPPTADFEFDDEDLKIEHNGDPDIGTTTVTLDACSLSGDGDSPQDSLVYKWFYGGVEDAEADSCVYITPQLLENEDCHVFALSVTDTYAVSDTIEHDICVYEPNYVPIANAGEDQEHNLPVDCLPNGGEIAVTLDGNASTDPDSSDIISWSWVDDTTEEQVSTESSFEYSLTEGTYSYTLTVTDPYGAFSFDSVVITVVEPNEYPTAMVVENVIETNENEVICLDGSNSYDEYDCALTYIWKINNEEFSHSADICFNVGEILYNPNVIDIYTLTVTDPYGLSDSTDVVVTIHNINQSPELDLGEDLELQISHDNDPLTTQYSFTPEFDIFDSDSDSLSFIWNIDGDFASADSFPTLTLDPGMAEIVCNVEDGFGGSTSDNITVFVLPEVNECPVANAGADTTIIYEGS